VLLVRLEVRRYKMIRQTDSERGNSMETYQGHRDKINRSGKSSSFKTTYPGLETTEAYEWYMSNMNRMPNRCARPQGHWEGKEGHAQCSLNVHGLAQMYIP
jgi:hypothetical protein